MLRLSHNQPSLWESVLPPELFRMSEELSKVDKLLEDERFFAPFRERFYTRVGRLNVPIATYLRMMYLKRCYKLRYETLVKEVKGSFTWRCFCHLSLKDRVPDDTTLIKLSHKYGKDALRDLNDAVVLKLKEEKVIRGRKLRMDTTVVEANIHYPTDASLLADGVRVITRTVVKLKKLGAEVGGGFVNHSRKVAEEVIARGQGGKAQLDAVKEKASQVKRLGEQLGGWLESTGKIVQQTKAVLRGCLRLPERLVSLFDPDARPIKRGGKPG